MHVGVWGKARKRQTFELGNKSLVKQKAVLSNCCSFRGNGNLPFLAFEHTCVAHLNSSRKRSALCHGEHFTRWKRSIWGGRSLNKLGRDRSLRACSRLWDQITGMGGVYALLSAPINHIKCQCNRGSDWSVATKNLSKWPGPMEKVETCFYLITAIHQLRPKWDRTKR